MLLSCHVFADLHGGRVDHVDQFGHSAGCKEADGVGGSWVGLEGEASGHIILAVEQHSLVILIDDDPYLLSLAVLGRDVDILLLPVVVEFELDLLGDGGLEDEVIETSADEGMGADVGVGHVVILTLLILALGYLLGTR